MCLFTSETHQVEVKKNWLKDQTGQFSRPLSLIEQKQSTDQSVGRRFLLEMQQESERLHMQMDEGKAGSNLYSHKFAYIECNKGIVVKHLSDFKACLDYFLLSPWEGLNGDTCRYHGLSKRPTWSVKFLHWLKFFSASILYPLA